MQGMEPRQEVGKDGRQDKHVFSAYLPIQGVLPQVDAELKEVVVFAIDCLERGKRGGRGGGGRSERQ